MFHVSLIYFKSQGLSSLLCFKFILRLSKLFISFLKIAMYQQLQEISVSGFDLPFMGKSKHLLLSCLQNLGFILNSIWGRGGSKHRSQALSPLSACLHFSYELECDFMLLLFIITTTATCMGFVGNCTVEILRVVYRV